MNRIRIATIASSLSLSIYFCLAGTAAMLIGPSTVSGVLLMPISLLEDLFSAAFDRGAFGCNLLSVLSLWLTFICVIDLSMILASIDYRHSARSLAANTYARRLLPRLRSV